MLRPEVQNDNKVEEIAESFINGNISWCKDQIKNNGKLMLKIREFLNEYSPEEGYKFFKIMTN